MIPSRPQYAQQHSEGPQSPCDDEEISITLYDLTVDPKTNLVRLRSPDNQIRPKSKLSPSPSSSAPSLSTSFSLPSSSIAALDSTSSSSSSSTELDKTLATINELASMLSRAPFPHCPPMTPPPPPNFTGITSHQNIRYTQIQKIKDEGNLAYNKKDYQTAVVRYSLAAEMSSSRALFENSGWAREEMSVILSNRSAAFASMKKWSEALVDAEAVIKLKRNWSKGYFRKSKTLQLMGRLWEAKDAILLGLEFEPENKDLCALRDELDEALELNRRTREPSLKR